MCVTARSSYAKKKLLRATAPGCLDSSWFKNKLCAHKNDYQCCPLHACVHVRYLLHAFGCVLLVCTRLNVLSEVRWGRQTKNSPLTLLRAHHLLELPVTRINSVAAVLILLRPKFENAIFGGVI